MAKWYERAFDAVAGEFGRAVADVRAKLIEEGFFGRKSPEPMSHDGPSLFSGKDGPEREEPSVLDWLYENHPEFFSKPENEMPDHEPERRSSTDGPARDAATPSFADQLGWERDSGRGAHTHETDHEIER